MSSVIMLVLNRFDLVWEGMLAAAIAAPLFALAVYFGGDKLLGLQTKRIERPLEEKIGELRYAHDASAVDISEEIERLEKKARKQLEEFIIGAD